ncbi:MAG: CDP-diacylglycerol--glycerol-3-phosphate 3-phosphatidyltransferase [Acidobacteriaceae bacterium]
MLSQLRATPNQLTLLRLCMIPFLVIAVLDAHFKTAFLLFVLAGISDGLDGLIARRWKQGTKLGQYLDPIADKLLLSTLFVVLAHAGLIRRYITVLVLGRDIIILMVCTLLFVTVGLRNFKPSLLGKTNTLAQILALTTTLLSRFYAPYALMAVRQGALWATVGLTTASGFHYVWLVGKRIGDLGNEGDHIQPSKI